MHSGAMTPSPWTVTYAPHPPQASLTWTLDQLARRDARFATLPQMRARGSLQDALQDSADLQQAHLTLRLGRAEYRASPGGWSDPWGAVAFAGWSELALEHALALDAPGVTIPRPAEPTAHWIAEVCGRRMGLAFVFWPAGPGRPAGLRARLNLADFVDRMELEFLLGAGLPPGAVCRVHTLAPSGQVIVERATPKGAGHGANGRAPASISFSPPEA